MPEQDICVHQAGPEMGPWQNKSLRSIAEFHSLQHPPSTGKRHPITVNVDDLLGLECPPISSATLNLLGSSLQASPSFDSPLTHPLHSVPLNPPSYTLTPVGPSNLPHLALSFVHLGSCSYNPHSPIRFGCFSSPTQNPRLVISTQQGSSKACCSLLKENPMGHRTDKPKKGRCLRAVDTDINLTFGEDVPMADALDTVRKVFVGRVRGRNYTMEHLRQWTMEIWGSLLKKLPVIKVLARG